MFYRLGLFAYRRRYAVILVWAVVLLASVPFLPHLESVLSGGGFANGTTDADRALSLMQRDLHYYPSAITIIFTDPRLRVTDAAFKQDMTRALLRLCGLPHLARIDTYATSTSPTGLCSQTGAPGTGAAGVSTSTTGAARAGAANAGAGKGTSATKVGAGKGAGKGTGAPAAGYGGPITSGSLISPDRHATYAVLSFNSALEVTQNVVPRLDARLRTRRLHTIVTGDPVVYGDMERLSTQDLAQVEKYTFPVALVLLVLVFGTLVAAGVPLIIGGASVAVTLALIFLLGHVTTVSTFALNTSTMIGLGVGIDYALLIVSRYREELARRPLDEAVATTLAQAGRAVLFSGCTVMLGLGGLLMFQATALRSMGVGGALVVLVAVLAALTLVPAVLAVLGRRVDALAILPRREGPAHFWPAVAGMVMRRPWPFIVGTLAVILFVAIPARQLRLNIPDATILPRSVPSRQGFDLLQQVFKVDANTPTLPVVYGSGPILQPRYLGALYDYTRRIARDRDVQRVASVVNLDPRLTRADYLKLPAYLSNPRVAAAVAPYVGTHATLVAVYPRPGLSQGAAEALVRRIRAVPLGGGLHVVVGGYTAGEMDYIAALYGDFPKAILFVVGSTFLVLLLLFRSVVLPLKAVVMNLLSLLGSYGALVFIFQQGHFATLLNFSPSGYVDEITPIVMFCVLFGLSMDYEVFLLTRIREEYCATGDNERAVARGLARTGRIITSAALILVVVAGSFAFTNLVLVKAVGLGLALAILIDATLIRSLLVPATMRVLGRWNWWAPRWLDRLLGRVERALGPLEPASSRGDDSRSHADGATPASKRLVS